VATIEVSGPLSHDFMVLEGERCSIGKSTDADYVIGSDPAISRIHVMLERIGGAWMIRDLNSLNGTFVNGHRLFGERPLRDGDEVHIGRTRLLYRDRVDPKETTETLAPPPSVTPGEFKVLVQLCRPLLLGSAFTQPASVREIADELVVSTAAVKQHLSHLYDKFGIIEEPGPGRRVRLANEALSRGAVTIADLASTTRE
jgi:pSer/pThr/pTyr-binding forkhead associated (FHA) protein